MDVQKIKKDLQAYYNAEALDREAGDRNEFKLRLRDKFCAMAKAEDKHSLLELGAGPGKDSKFFTDNGFTVTAVDLSTEMVGLCRQKGVEAYEMDFYTLSRIGKRFDCVWAMNCLLHVPKSDLDLVLDEVDAVLAPSGLFYMGVWGGEDSESFKTREEYPAARFFSFFSDERLKDMLSKHFDILDFENVHEEGFCHQSVFMRKR